MEAIGYIGRILSAQQTPDWTLGPFIMQAMLLLVAPALFAASIYMVLGRIVLTLDGEKHCLIKKKWLTKIFVGGDVLSFLVLCGGSYLFSSFLLVFLLRILLLMLPYCREWFANE